MPCSQTFLERLLRAGAPLGPVGAGDSCAQIDDPFFSATLFLCKRRLYPQFHLLQFRSHYELQELLRSLGCTGILSALIRAMDCGAGILTQCWQV